MARIVKGPKPKSLEKNAEKWTKTLLDEYEKQGGDSSKVDSKYWDKYRKPDVKIQLAKESFGKCMYCDTELGVSDYEHIEHIIPKKPNPILTYKWENFGWACSICNEKKGVENTLNPYEVDFEEVLDIGMSMLLIPKNKQDIHTQYFIDLLELNSRSKLVSKRCRECHRFEEKVKKLSDMKESKAPNISMYVKSLKLQARFDKEYYLFKSAILNKTLIYYGLENLL